MPAFRDQLVRWWAFALLLGACAETPRTQVTVIVDAEPMIRAAAARLEISILGGPGGSVRTERYQETIGASGGAVQFPQRIAVVPEGNDATRLFEVVARAHPASGPVLAEARIVTGFRAGRTLTATLLLEDCCRAYVGVCGPAETCRGCLCRAAFVDPTTLDRDLDAAVPDAADAAGGLEDAPGAQGADADAGAVDAREEDDSGQDAGGPEPVSLTGGFVGSFAAGGAGGVSLSGTLRAGSSAAGASGSIELLGSLR